MLQLSTLEVVLAYLILGLITFGLIAIGKKWIKNKHRVLANIPSRNRVNVFTFRPLFFKIGLSMALAVPLIALSWTTEIDSKMPQLEVLGNEMVEIEIAPPMMRSKSKLPVPKTLEKIELVEHIFQPVEPDEPLDIEDEQPLTEIEPTVDIISTGGINRTPKITPVYEIEPVDEIMVVAEQMPRFPGCESLELSNEDKRACAEKKMLELLYHHLKYPSIAKETNTEGMVVVRFVVNKKGEMGRYSIGQRHW